MMNERRVTVVGKALTSIKSKGFCSSGDGTVLVRTIDSSVADTASAAIPVDDDD